MQRDYGLVKYTVEPEVLETTGDSIPIVIRGVFPPKYFNKKAAMYFQPVVKYGDKEMKLKPISQNPTAQFPMYKQRLNKAPLKYI